MFGDLPSQTFDVAVLAVAAALLLPVGTALAEGPMNTDDAGPLDKGGMKVEAVWSKDDQTKGVEALFGFSVIENVEMEVGVAQATDDATEPSTKARGASFGVKWVPFQSDTGWSLGTRFDYHHARIDDHTTGEKFTEREYALTGLASYRRDNGQVLHINLGTVKVKARDESDTVGTWGVGYEFPIVDRLQLTTEVFGEEHSSPDKAVGLRYEVFDGFKVSAAVGRGNDRSFGQVGAAWEF
jgi:hypothetical protein